MKNVFVKPARDADGNPMLVRDPQTMTPLDPAGEWKPLSQFWSRRLRDADVIEAAASPATVIAPPASPAQPLG
ncbi:MULTISPECIES: DUF2635 domain-containing protein [unclassified Bradyrhizobium]|uniref:DUF2635 domain-containing protein n=1 Tax=unclassified Bradyrhizobium TaxID=2631580 RepID=UPI002916BB7D|nr:MULTISPECIES: DUF2635 domain-containing protein [unclassified Bradyrhizobium]